MIRLRNSPIRQRIGGSSLWVRSMRSDSRSSSPIHGDQLQITAPGLGLQTAWLNGQRVLIDGTSASAPIVSGANRRSHVSVPRSLRTPSVADHPRPGERWWSVGADPDYGSGILNLAWPMHWNDPGYVDPAISSHYLNPATGQMEFVVQKSQRGRSCRAEARRNQRRQYEWL
jgi:hypothetical protein